MRNKLILYSVLILLLQIFSSCQNEKNHHPEYENAEQYIQDIGFQGSILIRKGNEDILRKSFGMADKENAILNETDTEFRIGSMSKAFTVLGILKLKQEGLITSFDQTISDFVANFPNGDEITLSQLMKHSSGIPDHLARFEELMINQNQDITPADIFESIKETVNENGLLFTPGSMHQYSNANYLILAILIEQLSETAYTDYLKETLIPLSMNHTHKGSDIITNINEAKGYRNISEVSNYPMEIAFGAGDWVSNIPDLEKWANAWLNNLLSAEEKDAVFAQTKQDEITEFGMGWFTIRTHGKLAYFHGGDIAGFTSLIILFPESNGMLIALSNQENQRQKLDQMIDVFAENEF